MLLSSLAALPSDEVPRRAERSRRREQDGVEDLAAELDSRGVVTSGQTDGGHDTRGLRTLELLIPHVPVVDDLRDGAEAGIP
jgi:hypothetical protein